MQSQLQFINVNRVSCSEISSMYVGSVLYVTYRGVSWCVIYTTEGQRRKTYQPYTKLYVFNLYYDNMYLLSGDTSLAQNL